MSKKFIIDFASIKTTHKKWYRFHTETLIAFINALESLNKNKDEISFSDREIARALFAALDNWANYNYGDYVAAYFFVKYAQQYLENIDVVWLITEYSTFLTAFGSIEWYERILKEPSKMDKIARALTSDEEFQKATLGLLKINLTLEEAKFLREQIAKTTITTYDEDHGKQEEGYYLDITYTPEQRIMAIFQFINLILTKNSKVSHDTKDMDKTSHDSQDESDMSKAISAKIW